jgi:hypothetical protein
MRQHKEKLHGLTLHTDDSYIVHYEYETFLIRYVCDNRNLVVECKDTAIPTLKHLYSTGELERIVQDIFGKVRAINDYLNS